MSQFSMEAFVGSFNRVIDTLRESERITKETLKDLSRELLYATQQTEDIGYINRTIAILTPMNRKACILFFKEFSGFLFDDDEASFSKKDKKRYEKTKAKALEALADPHFNLWTWAEKNVEMEVKPLDLSKIQAYMKGVLKKAANEGIPQGEVLKAVFAGGFEPDALMTLLSHVGYDVEVKE